MLRKGLKWIGILLGGLVVLLLLAVTVLYFAGGARLNKTRSVQAEAITIQNNGEVLNRGEHLVKVACTSCHSPDLSGQALIADPSIGRLYSANITGLGETHTDDLVRAIRHGVSREGRQLMIMPAEVFIHFSAEDLGAIIAYLKTIPQVGEPHPKPELAFMGRILLASGQFGKVFPAEYIEHNEPFPAMPAIGANAAYGEYLSGLCTSCHGPDLRGAKSPDPASPPAPSLLAAGAWPEEQFIRTMRTGVTPAGRQMDPRIMPWSSIGKLDDDELKGIWLYLRSLGGDDFQ